MIFGWPKGYPNHRAYIRKIFQYNAYIRKIWGYPPTPRGGSYSEISLRQRSKITLRQLYIPNFLAAYGGLLARLIHYISPITKTVFHSLNSSVTWSFVHCIWQVHSPSISTDSGCRTPKLWSSVKRSPGWPFYGASIRIPDFGSPILRWFGDRETRLSY